jgi:hypothetical protein
MGAVIDYQVCVVPNLTDNGDVCSSKVRHLTCRFGAGRCLHLHEHGLIPGGKDSPRRSKHGAEAPSDMGGGIYEN